MALFFQLQDRMDEISSEYFRKLQDANNELALLLAATIRIQSVFRAFRVRKRWRAYRTAKNLVRKVLKGYLARQRTKALRMDRARRLNAVFFHQCATCIQRVFKGWLSRKHEHDFYGRKRYLETVRKRGEWTVEYLRREHTIKVSEAKEAEERQMKKEFEDLAGQLHHLVSTKSIAGVYNPPYNDVLPRAFEKPIEQHLRDSCKAKLPKSLKRPRHRSVAGTRETGTLSATHMDRARETAASLGGPPQDLPLRVPHQSRTASVGRMQKIQGPFRSREQIEVANAKASNVYRSIQSSAPYNAVDEDRKMQQKLSKLTRVSPIDFVAPGLPPERPPPSSVHTSVPHLERPVELRSDYLELPKIRDKPPFFTALPRDRHFDDYHDANLLPSGAV